MSASFETHERHRRILKRLSVSGGLRVEDLALVA
jgi:DeoR/GlpR family transcriptional regulator of sugar metabolism